MKITHISIPSAHSHFHTTVLHRLCTNAVVSIPKDFFHSVFPLGRTNSSDKTRLLKFVYAFLKQWNSIDKSLTMKFIRTYIDIEESNELQTIAVINIWDGKKEHVLNFQVIYMNGIIKLWMVVLT